jgi:hypothetical protein
MNQKYLSGLNYESCEASDPKFKGVYVINENNGAYYYFSTYRTLQNLKEYFFKQLSTYQKEVKKDWELHHIVERKDLKAFYTDAQVTYLYDYEWPCILIHKGQHSPYSRLLTMDKDTKGLFGVDKTKNMSKATLLNNVKEMYRSAYLGNKTLTVIAENVLSGVSVS